MKTKLFCVSLVLSIVALAFGGCATKPSAANSTSNTTESGSSADVQQGGMAGARIEGGRVFRGAVGEKRVDMTLVRDGDQLSGTYSYRKIGSDLSLKGTIDKAGKFTLKEFDGNKQTGQFKGEWSEPPNFPTAMLNGAWSKPSGEGELSFYAVEQVIEFSNGLRMVSKDIKEDDKKKHYWISADYPELTGASVSGASSFNAEVKRIIAKETQDFRKNESEAQADDGNSQADSRSFLEIIYDVTLATNDFVSVIFDLNTYSRGAAHPNHRSVVVNYDLKAGRTLKLADLFKPNSDFLKIISRYSIDDLKKQANDPEYPTDMIEQGAGPDPDNYQAWNISKKGLAITFDPYQVASYAEGPKHVMVPYSSLSGVIRPDGVLAQFSK